MDTHCGLPNGVLGRLSLAALPRSRRFRRARKVRLGGRVEVDSKRRATSSSELFEIPLISSQPKRTAIPALRGQASRYPGIAVGHYSSNVSQTWRRAHAPRARR